VRTRATRTPARLWDLAGRIYHEAIYQGSLLAAGSNTERLIERMNKNSRYIKRQARMVQILGSVYPLLFVTIPTVIMMQLSEGATHQWNLLVATFAGTVFLFIQTGYLMLLTLVATAEILAPELYRWPESLPLRAAQTGMLRVMALAREFLLPLSVIVLGYPVAAGIASGSFGVAMATLFVSLTHAVMTLSVTVLASWRLRRALRLASGNDRRATAVRVITMAGYGIGIVVVVAVMQFGTTFVASLLDEPRLTVSESLSVLRVLSLLPLPTSAASFVSALVARRASLSSALSLWFPLVGIVLYAGGAFLLLRGAWRLIGRGDTDLVVVSKSAAEPGAPALASVPLTVRTPRAAFRRQIFQAATRDTQVLLALLFPLVIPVATLTGPAISGVPSTVPLFAAPVMAAVMGGWILLHSLTRLQVGTGLLEASLPLVERDRAFPRLTLCAIIPTAGAIIAGLALLPPGLKLEGLLISAIPMIGVPTGFLVKTSLFGRIPGRKPRVVVEEVYIDHRFFKWVATLMAILIVAGGFIALRFVLGRVIEGPIGTVLYLAGAAIAGLALRFIAGRIFPAASRSGTRSEDGPQSGGRPGVAADR